MLKILFQSQFRKKFKDEFPHPGFFIWYQICGIRGKYLPWQSRYIRVFYNLAVK